MSNKAKVMIYEQKQEFLSKAADTGMKFDVEAGFALQQISGNEYAMRIATQNPDSLKMAFLNVAAIGLSLSPAAQLAYLVPRDGKICLDISYMGFLHLAQVTGAIQWGQADIVREHDTFNLQGIGLLPIHEYDRFATEEQRGKIVGVYCVVKTDGGDFLTHTMTIKEVEAIKALAKTKNIWVKHEKEMIKKTCVKQARKYWPRRERLDNAIHYMNTEGNEGIQVVDESYDTLDAAQIEQIEAYYIQLTEESKSGFLKWLQVDSVEEILQAKFNEALKMIKRKVDNDNS